MNTNKKPLALLLALVLMPGASMAEVASRGGGDQTALFKAQAMLQQMSAEKEALQAEKTQLQEESAKKDKKIEVLNAKIERTSKSLKNSSDLVSRYQDAVAVQRERMGEMRDKFQKLVDKYRELVAALKLVEAERVSLQEKSAKQDGALAECGKKNNDLYQATLDMIDKYEKKGVWDALLQKEPVTQLKRVEIENIVDDAKYQAEKMKVVDSGQ